MAAIYCLQKSNGCSGSAFDGIAGPLPTLKKRIIVPGYLLYHNHGTNTLFILLSCYSLSIF